MSCSLLEIIRLESFNKCGKDFQNNTGSHFQKSNYPAICIHVRLILKSQLIKIKLYKLGI